MSMWIPESHGPGFIKVCRVEERDELRARINRAIAFCRAQTWDRAGYAVLEGVLTGQADPCTHSFQANPGMFDSAVRYCVRCGCAETGV